ncbi:MAG: calcium-binding protein [Gaiellaceae bacterium]
MTRARPAPAGTLLALAVLVTAVLAVAPGVVANAAAATCGGRTATITGTAGPDKLTGTKGADVIDAGAGDDTVKGGSGDDAICGGAGNDRIDGGKGDDTIDGGLGDDRITQKKGNDVVVDAPGTLSAIVDARERDQLRDYAAARDLLTFNADVEALTPERVLAIPEIVLLSNATDDNRAKLLRSMDAVLATAGLGFYAEIWSYTTVEMTPGGFFGTCNHLFLDPDAFGGLSDPDARNVFMHESFHSFDCVNGGPQGALDEGAAIWITKAFFPAGLDPAETWAEATYGTKLYYRDINGQPDYPLAVSRDPTFKLLQVFHMLSQKDPSQLPWNAQDRLTNCYQQFWEPLNRNVDFFTVWLPAAGAATAAMLNEPNCRPLS